jgi:hypothetical protein
LFCAVLETYDDEMFHAAIVFAVDKSFKSSALQRPTFSFLHLTSYLVTPAMV